MDLNLFENKWNDYLQNGSPELWVEFYAILFTELAKVAATELEPEHLIWMKRAERFYAIEEDYERAEVLKKIQIAANNIFQARSELAEIMKNFPQ